MCVCVCVCVCMCVLVCVCAHLHTTAEQSSNKNTDYQEKGTLINLHYNLTTLFAALSEHYTVGSFLKQLS